MTFSGFSLSKAASSLSSILSGGHPRHSDAAPTIFSLSFSAAFAAAVPPSMSPRLPWVGFALSVESVSGSSILILSGDTPIISETILAWPKGAPWPSSTIPVL